MDPWVHRYLGSWVHGYLGERQSRGRESGSGRTTLVSGPGPYVPLKHTITVGICDSAGGPLLRSLGYGPAGASDVPGCGQGWRAAGRAAGRAAEGPHREPRGLSLSA